MDHATDQQVTKICLEYVKRGGVVIDTAINYRAQRAERSIGEFFRRGILTNQLRREDVFLSTKIGFVPYDGLPASNMKEYFLTHYVNQGLAQKSDLTADCHCLSPEFLRNQIQKSRSNMQVNTIDLIYVHNPETQLEEIPARLFEVRLHQAFLVLEEAVEQGHIQAYGLATWNGFRQPYGSLQSLQLERCLQIAEAVAEERQQSKHHFKAIQLPLNLAMPEAASEKTQKIGETFFTTLEAAELLGLSVATSSPLLQGDLCHQLPQKILERFPSNFSQAHCALSFPMSFKQVQLTLVGMKSLEHLEHNFKILSEVFHA